MQPISDVFLPDSEQFLPNSLLAALSTSAQPTNTQIDVVIGSNDLEALNYNGMFSYLLSCGHPHGLPPPGGSGRSCQTRLTKTT